MTLVKAIEIVSDHKELILVDKNPDLKAACNLLIEAGKRIQTQYDPDHQMMRIPLPGETLE